MQSDFQSGQLLVRLRKMEVAGVWMREYQAFEGTAFGTQLRRFFHAHQCRCPFYMTVVGNQDGATT